MEKYIVKNLKQVPKDKIDELAKYDVSTVYEAQGKQGLLSNTLKPISEGQFVCGRAITVACPAGDNLMIHAAVEVCKPGDVLVITTIGNSESGMIGELIVSALIKKGVQGVIIDAGVRDVKEIRALNFPVWSKAIYSEGTTKHRGGWVNSEVVCAGTIVNGGDIVMADDDGVVVVKANDIDSSIALSQKRMEKEARTKKKISNNEISLDFYDLRKVLKSEGVNYYEN